MLKNILKWGGPAALILTLVVGALLGYSRTDARITAVEKIAGAADRKANAIIEARLDSRVSVLERVNTADRLEAIERVGAGRRLEAIERVNTADRLAALEDNVKGVKLTLFAKARDAKVVGGREVKKASVGGVLARLAVLEERCEGCEEAPDGDGDNNADDAKPAPGAGK